MPRVVRHSCGDRYRATFTAAPDFVRNPKAFLLSTQISLANWVPRKFIVGWSRDISR